MSREKKTAWDALKGFALELVTPQTADEQEEREPSNEQFALELAIFAVLVFSYAFLVFSFFGNWLPNVFKGDKRVYAPVALALIAAQGVGLEVIAVAIEKLVQKVK
jgi:hypothetical protein